MFENLDADILRLLEDRKTKEAIKLIRERKKIGLAEARTIYEAFQRQRKGQGARSGNAAHRAAHEPPAVAHRGAHTFDPNAGLTIAPEMPRPHGMAPGEVPAPRNPIVNAAIVLMIFVAGLWYLLTRG